MTMSLHRSSRLAWLLPLLAIGLLGAAAPRQDDAWQRHPVRFREGSSGLKPAYTPLVSLLDGAFPGVAIGDFDGDGDLDVFLTNNGNPGVRQELVLPAASRPGKLALANFLYRNDGDTDGDGLPNFTDVAAEAGVEGIPGIGAGAVFADFDNDGDLDLYVANRLRGQIGRAHV